jgi:hypothetical protein
MEVRARVDQLSQDRICAAQELARCRIDNRGAAIGEGSAHA